MMDYTCTSLHAATLRTFLGRIVLRWVLRKCEATCILLALFFDTEDVNDIFLRNVDVPLDYTALHAGRKDNTLHNHYFEKLKFSILKRNM
jgi:hypothetical protein